MKISNKATATADKDRYIFNLEDKATLELIVQHLRPNQHQEQIIQTKRPVIYQAVGVPANFGAYNLDVIQDLINKKVIEYQVVKRIGLLTKDLKENKDMFLICNQDYSYYKAYDPHTTDKDKKHKSPYKLKKIIFNIEKINKDTKWVIICESTEKAMATELILNDPSIVWIGLHGIGTKLTDIADKLKGKKISILFDRRQDEIINTERERKFAVRRALECLKVTKDVSICEIPDLNQDLDIDDYLEIFDISDRENKLLEILKNKENNFDVDTYIYRYRVPVQQENNKKQHEIKYEEVKPDNRIFVTLKEFRDSIKDVYNNAIYLYKGKITVLRSTTGGGKTYSLIEALKLYTLIILCHNKDLVNELYQECLNKGITDIEVIESKQDTYYREIDNSNLDDTEKEHLREQLEILLSKGYSKKAKRLIESKLKKSIPYKRPSGNKSIITTHHKALFDPSIFNGSFQAVVIDEDITDKLIESATATIDKLEHEIDFYNHSSFKELINLAIEFLEKTNRNLNSIEFTKLFKYFLDGRGKGYLLNERFKVNINKKKEKAIKDFNKLPDKTGLLLKLIESIKNESAYLENKTIAFKTLNKFETNHTTIMLDATADKENLQAHGFKVSKFIDIAIKNDNLKVIQYPENTYKTGNILKNDKTLKDFENEVKEIHETNNQAILFTTKAISKKIKFLQTPYYGNDDKGKNSIVSNEFILTTPKSNELDSIARAKLLYGDKVDNTESHYINERTGYIDQILNKEVTIGAFHFKNKYLDKVYQSSLKIPMRQALGRGTRSYDKPVTVHIKSNVSLFDLDIRVDEIVLKDKSNLVMNQDKTIQAEKELRQTLINSLIKTGIIKTDNLKKYFSKIENNGKLWRFKYKKFATFDGKLKVKSLCSSQFAQSCYIYTSYTEVRKLENNSFNLDSILLDIKEKYFLSDNTIDKLKFKVLKELKIKDNYLDKKQGLFYSHNETIANQFKALFKVPPGASTIGPDNNLDPENTIVVLTDTVKDDLINDKSNTTKVNISNEVLKPVIDDRPIVLTDTSSHVGLVGLDDNSMDDKNIPANSSEPIRSEINDNAIDKLNSFKKENDNFIREFPTLDLNIHSKIGIFLFTGDNYDIFNNKVINLLEDMVRKNKYIDQDIFDLIEKKYTHAIANNLIDQSHFLNAIAQFILFNKEYCNKFIKDRIDFLKKNSNDSEVLKPNHSNNTIEIKKEIDYKNRNTLALKIYAKNYTSKLISENKMLTNSLIENINLWVKQSTDKETYYRRNYLLNHLSFFRQEINNRIAKNMVTCSG